MSELEAVGLAERTASNANARLFEAVAAAREIGATWDEIAEASNGRWSGRQSAERAHRRAAARHVTQA